MDSERRKHLPGTWVHVFEEDTERGAVFRPDHADIPLSRRPRERLELHPDGTAVLMTGGPDDRYVPQPADWMVDGDAVAVRDASGTVRMRVLDASPDRLLIEIRRPNGRAS